MLSIQLKQAEVALADGRLEDAFRILQMSAIRDHRRGQALIKELITAFTDRANGHLQADQWKQAKIDCDRAAELGGNQIETAALAARIEEARANIEKQDHRKKQSLKHAKALADRGDFLAGHEICEQLSTTTAAELKYQISDRQSRLSDHLHAAKRFIDSNKFELAIPEIQQAINLNSQDRAALELARVVVEELAEQVWLRFSSGRIDQAISTLQQIQKVGVSTSHLNDAIRFADRLSQAKYYLKNLQLTKLHQELSILKRLNPDAVWIDDVTNQTKTALDAIIQIQSSPLELALAIDSLPDEPLPARMTKTSIVSPEINIEPSLPMHSQLSKFLLHVDGSGTVLVATGDRVEFGQRKEIDLLGGNNLPAVTIERVDDGYFMRCPEPITINNKKTSSKLLSSGDRIELNSRHSLKFHLPCAASTSAVVDLVGVKHVRPEVRRIILLDNALVIANHGASHIMAKTITESFVLFVKNNQLMARAMNSGRETVTLLPGQNSTLGSVGLVMKPY